MPTELKPHKVVTIDEKIQELVDWSAKYPKAKVEFVKSSNKMLQEYAQSEEELKKLQEQYERIQRYYGYIKSRRSQRKTNTFTRDNVSGRKYKRRFWLPN